MPDVFGLIRATPKRLMAAVKPRCFLATNGNTLNYLTMTSHYDTPRAFDKNLLVCHIL